MLTRSRFSALTVLALAVGCGAPKTTSPTTIPEQDWTTVQSLAFSFDTQVDVQIDHIPARLTAETPKECSIMVRMPNAMTSTMQTIGGPQHLTVDLPTTGKYNIGGNIPSGTIIKVQARKDSAPANGPAS